MRLALKTIHKLLNLNGPPRYLFMIFYPVFSFAITLVFAYLLRDFPVPYETGSITPWIAFVLIFLFLFSLTYLALGIVWLKFIFHFLS